MLLRNFFTGCRVCRVNVHSQCLEVDSLDTEREEGHRTLFAEGLRSCVAPPDGFAQIALH